MVNTATWVATGGFAIIVAIRILQLDQHPLSVAAIGTFPVLLLPAYLLLGIALQQRQWVTVLVLTFVVISHAFLSLPEIRMGRLPVKPPEAVAMRVATANLWDDNTRIEDLAAELVASQADIVCVQEMTPSHLRALERAGFDVTYAHRVIDSRPGARGSAIFSRLPLSEKGLIALGGSPRPQVTVTTARGPVRIVNVHTTSPLSIKRVRSWKAQHEKLSELASASGHHLVLIGDFNSTSQHRPFRSLERSGMNDVFSTSGTGVGMTWPNRKLGMSVMRLDHVLTGDGIRAVRLREGTGRGSDHRPLIADLAVW